MSASVEAVAVADVDGLAERRPWSVVEPTLLLTLAGASLYFFGALARDNYYDALGVPWDVPCSPYDCLLVGSEVAAVVAVCVLPFVLAGLVVKRRPGRLVLENLPYLGTGLLLLLMLPSVFAPKVDVVQRIMGIVGAAGGVALLRAGLRRQKEGRTWLEEARRREPKALAVAALCLFLAQFLGAMYIASYNVDTAQRGHSDGFTFTQTPAILLMKDPASPLHGREVRIVSHVDGMFYAYDPAEGCPLLPTEDGNACLYVVMENEVASVQVSTRWS